MSDSIWDHPFVNPNREPGSDEPYEDQCMVCGQQEIKHELS